eukprot:TRINITY_DN70436_c0_g1_i1.p1 TRINITY_DN70436_c0_g1~~TRINITY_DN70436_c0_g1_i1.p1  ORF type:complete len:246 (+),score=7.76 TRINITY_DN70436_c0_g1_i1:70-738(+)
MAPNTVSAVRSAGRSRVYLQRQGQADAEGPGADGATGTGARGPSDAWPCIGILGCIMLIVGGIAHGVNLGNDSQTAGIVLLTIGSILVFACMMRVICQKACREEYKRILGMSTKTESFADMQGMPSDRRRRPHPGTAAGDAAPEGGSLNGQPAGAAPQPSGRHPQRAARAGSPPAATASAPQSTAEAGGASDLVPPQPPEPRIPSPPSPPDPVTSPPGVAVD